MVENRSLSSLKHLLIVQMDSRGECSWHSQKGTGKRCSRQKKFHNALHKEEHTPYSQYYSHLMHIFSSAMLMLIASCVVDIQYNQIMHVTHCSWSPCSDRMFSQHNTAHSHCSVSPQKCTSRLHRASNWRNRGNPPRRCPATGKRAPAPPSPEPSLGDSQPLLPPHSNMVNNLLPRLRCSLD